MKRLAFLAMFVLAFGTASASMWYVDSSVPASGDGKSWETAFQAIQEGIDAASSGDTVTVAEGLYVENIHFNGKNIVLTSTDPLNPDVVVNTIIDGNQAGSVFTFSGTETEACILSGFTIRNGVGGSGPGGGICGGTWDRYTRAAIQNNTVSGNSGLGLVYCSGTVQNSTISGNSGGGLLDCDGIIQNNTITGNSAGFGGGLERCGGTIQNNTIAGNSARAYGGGLFDCQGLIRDNAITGNAAPWGGGLRECGGTIQNNTIEGNSAEYGGGLYDCAGTIQNNTITGNSAQYAGGGLHKCNGRIQNNTIARNSAVLGGGLQLCNGMIQNNTITGNSAETAGGLEYCDGTIRNNTITGNSAEDYGGGLGWCNGMIQNNTITGNSAGESGGGLSGCAGTIQNCIIWGNRAPQASQLYGSGMPTYSCIQDWSGGGEGNIASEPEFLDLNAGDYRLQAGSQCIDAGYKDAALPATDIAGMHRIMFGGKSLTVDMGAYEFHIWPPSFDSPMGEAILKWSSLAGKTYSVYRSSDMLTWELAVDNLPSVGDTFTTWLDPTTLFPFPEVQIRFYRIIEDE